MSAEEEIRDVLATIDAAWRLKEFDRLETCFHEHAVIAGPDYVVYAKGRSQCAESYREFANNADVLDYSEESHDLYVWEAVAVHTFRWRMTYRREGGSRQERGSDQLVLQHGPEGWQVAFRHIHFQPTGDAI